jgi:hypothetical protein
LVVDSPANCDTVLAGVSEVIEAAFAGLPYQNPLRVPPEL